MAGPQHLLRKKSIERLSSPEQLDTAMRVTSPVGWVALSALGTVIITAIIWSIYGSLNVQVDGTGILLRGDTVQTIQIATDGEISELYVAVGDSVKAGQPVAKMALGQLNREIETSQARISDLQAREISQTEKIRKIRASYSAQLRDLRDQLRKKQELLNKGLVREQDVIAIKGRIGQIEAQITQSEMGEIDVDASLKEEQRRLTQLQEQLEANEILKSHHDGVVAAVFAQEGDLVATGSRLLNLEPPEEAEFQVLLFIPFTEGKKVRPGMPVKIAPTNVKPEEFGFIVGTIAEVSTQPVTPEEVRRTLNNDQLAQTFAKDTPFRVRAQPDVDDSNLSGFKWTSGDGPPIRISSSTPCSAQVVVDVKKPISYVIPMLRKATGIS